MKITRKKLCIVTISTAIILLTGLYLLLFGRFNFISPWIIGFDKMETKKAIIYYHENKSNVKCLLKIDSLIAKVEEFHKLRFQHKVEIIISANIKEHKRYSWHYASFITQPFLGRLYLLYIEDYYLYKNTSLYAYIQHELSHSVINQNISNTKLLNYPLWFMEGIATYSSDMMGIEGYPAKETVNKRIAEGYFILPKDWGKFGLPRRGLTARQYPFKDTFWFAYSEFGYIVEDLIEKFGKPRLIEFLHLTLKDKKFEDAFLIVYKMRLDDYIGNYISKNKSLTISI